jgi:membrane-associated phospholipid phosphatase
LHELGQGYESLDPPYSHVVYMHLHESLQKGVERLFFKNKSTIWSKRVAYMIGNTILMLILFYVILNTIAYDWTGTLYPEGSGFHLDGWFGTLDQSIPFVPEMAIFYVFLFYGMVIFTMVYFAYIASDKGYALGWSLVIINAIAIAVYIVFPVSTYWYRLQYGPGGADAQSGFWADLVYTTVFARDTSFNDFPSLHAGVSVAVAYAWYRYARSKPMLARNIMAVVTFIIATGVILSTLFVKQHYIADEISGFVLAFVVSKLVFRVAWKNIELDAIIPEKND